MSKKFLKISMGVVAAIGAIFLFVVGFLFIISYILSIGSWEKISTDIDDYGKFRENAGIYERIFPEDLDEVKIVNQYIHLYDKNGSAGNQIFLDVIYEEELFVQKINYWKNYNSSYIESNYYREPKYDDAFLFNNPTLVIKYSRWVYEYISYIEAENRIIYVYIDYGKADILIPNEFLPKNYYINIDKSEGQKDGYYYSVEGTDSTMRWYE